MRLLSILKGKIHRAVVTEANVNYIGSISIDSDLMELSGIVQNERVHVWNIANGKRLETYAIAAPAGSGTICLNGAAAHHVSIGDLVIIAAFCWTDEPVEPLVILVDEHNRYVSHLPVEISGVEG